MLVSVRSRSGAAVGIVVKIVVKALNEILF
jgi:hypothetical protein